MQSVSSCFTHTTTTMVMWRRTRSRTWVLLGMLLGMCAMSRQVEAAVETDHTTRINVSPDMDRQTFTGSSHAHPAQQSQQQQHLHHPPQQQQHRQAQQQANADSQTILVRKPPRSQVVNKLTSQSDKTDLNDDTGNTQIGEEAMRAASDPQKRPSPVNRNVVDINERETHERRDKIQSGHKRTSKSEKEDTIWKAMSKIMIPMTHVSSKHLSKLENQLLKQRESEPEHMRYNNDLLVRRMKMIHQGHKHVHKDKDRTSRVKMEKDGEEEDSWEEELRIRGELADMAAHQGLQMKKERLAHPDLIRPSSPVERIKKDAEEILRRREQIKEQVRKSWRKNPRIKKR